MIPRRRPPRSSLGRLGVARRADRRRPPRSAPARRCGRAARSEQSRCIPAILRPKRVRATISSASRSWPRSSGCRLTRRPVSRRRTPRWSWRQPRAAGHTRSRSAPNTPRDRRLKQQVQDLTETAKGLNDRLQSARDNNRFLDKRIADLEAELEPILKGRRTSLNDSDTSPCAD